MKKIRFFIIGVLTLMCSFTLVAQTIVNVTPGYGTLNAAITAHGSATYVLQAGGWYGLNQPVEIDVPIQIIGTDSTGMPATIQTGATASGTTFNNMFTVLNNLTIKNVFIVNADLNNGVAIGVFLQNGPSRLILDSVTVDPIGNVYLVQHNSDSVITHITNSLLMRQGNKLSVNDGHVFELNYAYAKLDSLYLENNTFVDVGTGFMTAGTFDDRENVWVNHNSFFFGKANFDNLWGKNNEYVTNNLMWQQDIHPIQYTWANYFPDAGPKNRMQGLIYDDTLNIPLTDSTSTTETLPSTRKHFIEYNSNYRSQGLWDLVKYLNDQGWAPAYLYDFIPSIANIDSCRETRMYNDKSSFPYFFYNNNIRDYGAENKADDPQFIDQKIYTLTDTAIAWATQSAYQVWGHQASDPSTWPNYFYSVDGNEGNPTTWPRFNGAYTNSKLMTASIEKLPLGDLNWFPSAKAIWQVNQAKIMNYILAENESQMNLTGVKKEDSNLPEAYKLSQNYPNPFNPTTIIQYSIQKQGLVTLKVYNMLGEEVATLVNQNQNAGNYSVNFNASQLASGVYMYRIDSGNFTATKKLILLK